MSFKMDCPRCMKTLNVTEKAFGKTVPCPSCNQPIKVLQPTQPSVQTGGVAGPPSWSGAEQNGHATPDTATPLPSGMPPMPDDGTPAQSAGDPLAFLNTEPKGAPIGGRPNPSEARGSIDVLAGGTRRPAGLVWIIFYWSVSGALLAVVGWTLTCVGGFLGGLSSGLADAVHSREAPPALVTEVAAFAGLLMFHVGLLTELACYGLWTFRRWGLSLAKILAVVYAVGSLIGLVAALVMRAGIVANLAGLVISVGIVVYLYGSSNLSERLQQVVSRVRKVEGRTWEGYD